MFAFVRQFLPPMWVCFLLLLVILEIIADLFAKQFGITGRMIFGALALLGFILANTAWLISLRSGAQLSTGSIIFSALSSVGAVLIGLLLYHEKINTYQIIGIVLGIIAIIFLTIA